MEVHSGDGSFAEEDWNEPAQIEVSESVESDKPMTMETRMGGRRKTSMINNRCGDDFLIGKKSRKR